MEVVELTESMKIVDLTAKSPAEIKRVLKEKEDEGWKLVTIGRFGNEVYAFLLKE